MSKITIQQYIPLDKSWMIRLGMLDLLHGYNDMQEYLTAHSSQLSSDLLALLRILGSWNTGKALDVGESGTLYRFVQFADWKRGLGQRIIKRGTLVTRSVTNNPSIIALTIPELLLLDNGTSQWASAALLLGDPWPQPNNAPYKLTLTYQAIKHWKQARSAGQCWQPRFDQTIVCQAEAYIRWRQTGKMEFTPEQAEDYCFARAFDLMTANQGEQRWPSLRQHESDRILEMERMLSQTRVSSQDHRVVQAIALRKGKNVQYSHPDCVSKSWPQFWQFYETIEVLAKEKQWSNNFL